MEMDGAEVLAVRPGHKFSLVDLDYALSKQRLVIARVTFPWNKRWPRDPDTERRRSRRWSQDGSLFHPIARIRRNSRYV
jgi:hypothetical protein